MAKDKNKDNEDRTLDENFEKFENKKNNKYLRSKKKKNKKKYVEDLKENKWN